jgi:uncharacterized protein (TIGR00369 family)
MNVYPRIDPEFTGLAYVAERKIPFHIELGLQIVHLVPGQVIARIPWRPALIGDTQRPAVHGGVISLLVDVVGGFAVFSSREGQGTQISTIDLRTDYLRPGKPECDLYGVGRLIRCGARVAVARMEIYSNNSIPPETPSNDLDPIALGQASYNVNRAS